jgi:site-specific DNA-methyltransferase (adenine-specific)
LEHRLEGIIILGEIHLPESQKILTTALLDKQQHPEIRAGAAWALGELRKPDSVDALIQTFTELAEPIRIEAVRALRKISEIETTNIISRLPSSNEDQRAGIAWAVSRSGRFIPATCNTTGGATIMGSFPYPRNGIIKLDYEFILIFKKLGDPPKVSREIKEKSKLTTEEWNEYFYGHWNFPGERQDKHLAMFPEELPKRLIKMFSFVGDTVLDPFLGSGTTCLAAKNLNRNSVGYEINKDFLPAIKGKIKGEINVVKQKKTGIDFKKEIQKLPYAFKDPVKFDNKIDPKKLKFGSKIDNSDAQRETYYSVKEIISPEIVILDNDLKVRLLGVKENKAINVKALQFLKEKLKGQKVFLKFDATKYDKEGNLLCYLYLKNKTFINAHLIKNHLAKADSSMNFRYRDKFIAMQKSG